MPIDRQLLEILCCPVSKQSLRTLSAAQLEQINQKITGGDITNAGNEIVTEALAEGLITQNGQRIYRIDDNIPVMLENESIPADQFDNL
tara:strand:+ start:89 stop:355 length:267 start_codon:yes stop_codon:yes gene_type:complete